MVSAPPGSNTPKWRSRSRHPQLLGFEQRFHSRHPHRRSLPDEDVSSEIVIFDIQTMQCLGLASGPQNGAPVRDILNFLMKITPPHETSSTFRSRGSSFEAPNRPKSELHDSLLFTLYSLLFTLYSLLFSLYSLRPTIDSLLFTSNYWFFTFYF